MKVAELINAGGGQASRIRLKEIERNVELTLRVESFVDNRGNLKKEIKEGVLKTTEDSPEPRYCLVEYNNANQVTKWEELPYKLPLHIAEFVRVNKKQASNYGLAVEKAGRFVKDKLEYMAENRKELFHVYQHNEDLNKSIHSKQKATLVSFESQGYQPISVTKKQTWRTAIGLGEASAYNNGFTFHKVYGIPYIPGQAVQGVVRNWIITTCFNSNENEALEDAAFCYLFGKGDKGYTDATYKGKLIFLDAFPQGAFKIEPDVMNPHYGDYYQQILVSDGKGGKVPTPPADWLNPSPIFFMTIKEATFPFHVLIRDADDVEMTVEKIIERYGLEKDEEKKKVQVADTYLKDKKPSKIIEHFLVKSLSIHGVGAKTAVGYGRMLTQAEIEEQQQEIERFKEAEKKRLEDEAIEQRLTHKELLKLEKAKFKQQQNRNN